MEIVTAPRGASAYRVSLPFTISHQLHDKVARVSDRIGIAPSQAFVTAFIVLLRHYTERNTLSVYVHQAPYVADKCMPLYFTNETTFRALASDVADHLVDPEQFPIFVRFDDGVRGLELELEQFDKTLQPYVGYIPRRYERKEIIFLIEKYRSLLNRFVALPELPLNV